MLNRVPKKEIARAYKSMKPVLDNLPVEAINIKGEASRFATMLQLPRDLTNEVKDLLDAEKELLLLEGKQPATVIAACIFAIVGIHRRIAELKRTEEIRATNPKAMPITLPPSVPTSKICDICTITEPTMRNSYKTLYENREKLLAHCKTLRELNITPDFFVPM